MSELKVDKITPRLGTTLTLGDTGDTINFGSGVLPNFENLTVTGDLTVDTNSLKVDSTNNFVGIGTASPSVALDVVGAITATGAVTGNSFSGSGASLTALNASNISTGTLNTARLPTDITISATAPKIKLSSSTGGTSELNLHRVSDDDVYTDWKIRNEGGPFRIRKDNSSQDDMLMIQADADVKLYYNGSEKLATTSTGIDVSGEIVHEGVIKLNVDSAYALISGGSATNTGANLTMYGGTNADAGDFRFRNGAAVTANITDAGQIQAYPLGPSTPTFSFTTDTNTGMTRPTTDTLTFVTGGSERVRIDSSGNVGIGTTSPSSLLNILGTTADADGALGSKNPQFVITGGNTNNPLEFGMDNSGATAVGFIQSRNTISGAQYLSLNPSGGNVGIGTSSPQRNLHVHQPTASSSFLQLTNTSTGSAADSDGLRVGVDANSYAYLYQGENQHLAIGTNNTERMRITSDGALCIGITSGFSDSKLHVDGSVVIGDDGSVTTGETGYNNTLFIKGASAAGGDQGKGCAAIQLGDNFSGSSHQYAIVNGFSAYGSLNIVRSTGVNTNPLRTSSGVVDFTIRDNGNVGIGQTSPSQKLDVNGTVKATAFQGDGSALTGVGGNTPAFAVAAGQNTAMSANTFTHITFATELVDTDNAFASSAFTVPSGQGGRYFIGGVVVFDSKKDNVQLSVTVGGSDNFDGQNWRIVFGNDFQMASVSYILDLSAGDVVRLGGETNSTTNLSSADSYTRTKFWGFKI